MNKNIKFTPTTLTKADSIIREYIDTLAYPLDSYLEDQLYTSKIYFVEVDNHIGGFYALEDDTLQFFYITKEFYLDAVKILAQVIKEHLIKNIQIISSAPQINALIIEWDYTMERMGCWFCDNGIPIDSANKIPNAIFRPAELADVDKIRTICGDFFDEVSGGFNTLEERIKADTIFVLEEAEKLYGCGIIEYGRLCTDYASIGMFTNSQFRQMGIAKTILLNLKKIVYQTGKKPIAGCWYYNTLSRKSMASAGMINTTLGYIAKLIKKDNPPIRTGNPPSEEVI